MLAFGIITAVLFVGLVAVSAYSKRDEISANWSKYRDDPLFMFAAPMFKPSDDPRTPAQFATDNFSDVLQARIQSIMNIFLEPLFKFFFALADTLKSLTNGALNMRGLVGNMYEKMRDVTNIFERRSQSTLHALRITYTKLYDSMNKTFGIATAAIYSGLNTYYVIDASFQLMIKVAIGILIGLVVLTIFFFFVLAPFIPLILTTIAVIAGTAMGGAVGGMGSAFCFGKGTRIVTKDSVIPIERVQIGQTTFRGAKVTGVMEFDTFTDELHSLYGVQVSGSHILFDDENMPLLVADHPLSVPLMPQKCKLYCLITGDHKIDVVTHDGIKTFADWEEIEHDDDLKTWNQHVQTALNPASVPVNPTASSLESEACVSPFTKVMTPLGPVEIRGIFPGMYVLDTANRPTRVNGIVRLSSDSVSGSSSCDGAQISCGSWIQESEECDWKQPSDNSGTASAPAKSEGALWYNLFTDAGTFTLAHMKTFGHHICMRDFSDVGSDKIDQTYEFVLNQLSARNFTH